MPCFDFQSADGQIASVYLTLNEPREAYSRQVINGVEYKRVWSAPLTATDMATRPRDATKEDFNRVTNKRGIKVGDLWEISAEMSECRKQREGIDGVKEAHYRRYEEEYGEKHPDVARRERVERANARLKEWGIKLTP